MKIICKENIIVVRKSNRSLLKDWFLFFMYSMILFSGFFIILFYTRILQGFFEFLGFSVLFFLFYYLINRKNLKSEIIMIEKIDEGKFRVNKELLINKNDSIELLLYEYSGELLMRSVGNLFLRVNYLEIRIVNGITESNLNEILNLLKRFLGRDQINLSKVNTPF